MNSREFQLLLNCTRSQPDAEAITTAVDKGVNWQTVLEFAQQHGVRAILFQTLRSVCWDSVPEATRLDLEVFVRANAERNLSLTAELFRVLAAFHDNDIP